jgi:hypothetical protein
MNLSTRMVPTIKLSVSPLAEMRAGRYHGRINRSRHANPTALPQPAVLRDYLAKPALTPVKFVDGVT